MFSIICHKYGNLLLKDLEFILSLFSQFFLPSRCLQISSTYIQFLLGFFLIVGEDLIEFDLIGHELIFALVECEILAVDLVLEDLDLIFNVVERHANEKHFFFLFEEFVDVLLFLVRWDIDSTFHNLLRLVYHFSKH